jgi:nucleotide-binding universal stress UspA family protein
MAMIAFRHILCPIDFSETSMRALTYAAAFAAWYKAELEVLHVVPAFDPGLVPALPHHFPDGGWQARSHDEIISEISHAISAAGGDEVSSSALVQEGRAHEVIVDRARVQPADLLVMGTHGRSGVNRLLLGSVTEKVLRTAPCPTLTVSPGAPSASGAPVELKRLLCAVDYSPSARKALQYALELGRQAGAAVTVLHALEYMELEEQAEPSPFDPCYQPVIEERRRGQRIIDHAREQLHAHVGQESNGSGDIQEVVAIGRAYKAILRQAAEGRADLIVMGAQGTGGLELMLYGSNTQHVVRAAACPVLTVRG